MPTPTPLPKTKHGPHPYRVCEGYGCGGVQAQQPGCETGASQLRPSGGSFFRSTLAVRAEGEDGSKGWGIRKGPDKACRRVAVRSSRPRDFFKKDPALESDGRLQVVEYHDEWPALMSPLPVSARSCVRDGRGARLRGFRGRCVSFERVGTLLFEPFHSPWPFVRQDRYSTMTVNPPGVGTLLFEPLVRHDRESAMIVNPP